MHMTESRARPVATRPGLLRAYSIVAVLTAVFVLGQAFLAGRGINLDRDIITIHRFIGDFISILPIAGVALALLAGLPRRARAVLLGHSVLLLVLIIVQTGLGYAGRDNPELRAWHVPTGVLIFGLAITNITFANRAIRGDLPDR